MQANKNKAVFLDRDGVLIEDKNYICKIEQVVLIPGAIEALKKLQDNGFLLIIVTNQSGVGRGYFTIEDVVKVNQYVEELFRSGGVHFKKIYFATEAPDQPSRARKPSPAFLFDARDEFDIDLSNSYMIGDKIIDLQCGWNAGVKKSILVRTGYGVKTIQEHPDEVNNALIVENIVKAAEWILNSS